MTTQTALALPEDRPGPRIIAVGGGKGGVGKTVITANLATALAERGHRVAVVDVDLGGANLHTVLGVPYPARTLSDFLERRAATLQEVMTGTSLPTLWLLSAARPQMGMANLRHASKLKLLRHIREMDVDYALLDLGAGTSFDSLDFFLSAHQGLLVAAPTPTSVENTYHFIRSTLKRSLAAAAKNRAVASALRQAEQGGPTPPRSPRELIARARATGAAVDRALSAALDGMRWSLALNQARKASDKELGPGMARTIRDYFGIPIQYLGCLEDDDSVWDSVQLKRPTLTAFPASAFSRVVRSMIPSLLEEGGPHV